MLAALADDWQQLDPALADPARAIARAYRSPDADRTTWIHGDFYAQQVLVDAAGTAALLDFDEAGPGDPHRDLGNLVAHAIARVREGIYARERGTMLVEEFLEAYASTGESVDEARLRAEIGRSLALLSHAPLRSLDPGWRAESEARLVHARAILEGARPVVAMEVGR